MTNPLTSQIKRIATDIKTTIWRILHPNVYVAYHTHISLKWLADNNLLDALQCILSENAAEKILLVIAPCQDRRWPLPWLLLRRKLVKTIEDKMSRCNSETCIDPLTERNYPDIPSEERCMKIEEGEKCLIIYTSDIKNRL